MCEVHLNVIKAIFALIMTWWREHEYDTCGLYGDYNVFDDKPEIVELAERYIEIGSSTVYKLEDLVKYLLPDIPPLSKRDQK